MKLCGILEELNRRHNQNEKASAFVDECSVGSEQSHDLSIQLLQTQKSQLIDLQELFEP